MRSMDLHLRVIRAIRAVRAIRAIRAIRGIDEARHSVRHALEIIAQGRCESAAGGSAANISSSSAGPRYAKPV